MVSVGLDCPRIAELATPSGTVKLSVELGFRDQPPSHS